jgi:hypothetical protein
MKKKLAKITSDPALSDLFLAIAYVSRTARHDSMTRDTKLSLSKKQNVKF